MSLDEGEHRRIFLDEIVPDLFAGAQPSPSPGVVVMGGQPGSGKSALLPIAAAHLAVGDAAGVQIVGDDLREYSPEFRRLL